MSQHFLQGQFEKQTSLFKRRDVLKAASAWVAMGSLAAATAQQRSNVVLLVGDALLNGNRLLPEQTVQTGDWLQTGPDSSLVFVMGNASFLARENTVMRVERGATLATVGVLRIATGAVASAWNNKESGRAAIVTPTLTASVRGSNAYTEVLAQPDKRTYFCNCCGTVDFGEGGHNKLSQAKYHQSFWADAQPKSKTRLTPTDYMNHTDEEQEFLAELINQRTQWQTIGRKGKGDGSGNIDS